MKYDFVTVMRLIAATVLPVLLSAALYLAEKKTRYGKIKSLPRQIIAGVLFGGIAVLATEFGIPAEGATLNVRNAAPLSAGLIFGAPAGIIAGVIGGVYRFFATFWGAGTFSVTACTIGCVLAGVFGAGCRKFMFDDKKPGMLYGLMIGGTTEVLHMLLVFITNMNDVYGAYKVVAVCAVPMIACCAVSVMLSLGAVALIGKERIKKPLQNRQISQIFQFLLMICVVVAFAATMAFTSSLQTKIAYANADSLLSLTLGDVEKDAEEAGTGEGAEADIIRAVKNRHIGKEGGVIVCNSGGIIIYDRGGAIGKPVSALENAKDVKAEPNVRFKATIGEEQSYCMYSETNGFYLVAFIPVSEAMFSRDISVTILAFMEVIVFAALFVHIYFLLKKLIVDNIHKINTSLARITDGDLNVYVNVRENAEFASLSDDINATVDTLKRYIAEAEGRIDRELEFARQIQHSALPSVFPPYPDRKDFDVYAVMDAAKEVGGDFYDFYLVGNSLVFSVADVSGKGIPAALFMMRAKTLLKNLVESGKGIDEAMTEANRALSENNEAEMFVTAWLGKLDLSNGTLEYVNAGHNPPLIGKRNGEFEYLRTRPNFVLAGMKGTKYSKHTLELSSGDELFVYTDGVTEATDLGGELYGEERLKNVLAVSGGEPECVCKAVRKDIDEFVKGAEQSDDITMLCVKYTGATEKEELNLATEKSSLEKAADFLTETLKKWQTPEKVSNRVLVAADEIYSNIFYYSGAANTLLTVTRGGGKITLRFSDDGKPYDPTTAKEPNVNLSAEEREIGGLGIYMVKKTAAEIDYRYEDGKNVLTVSFAQ